MHRRLFMGGVFGLASTPALAASGLASPGSVVEAYARRLQAGLDRTGGGRFVLSTEEDLADAHHRIRREQRLPPLAPHKGLALAARAHAADQVLRGYFAHESPDGFTPSDRVGLLARTFVGLPGENIIEAHGSYLGADPERLMDQWMESPGHRQNILKRTYTHFGVGAVQSGRRTVAVAVFGERYAELERPIPLSPAPDDIAAALASARPAVLAYDLSPVGRDERQGAFGVGAPPTGVRPGPYTVRPHLPLSDRRFTIVLGPIVELRG